MATNVHKTMASVVSLEKIEIIRSQEFMLNKARLNFLKIMIILGPKTAILGPQFCRILVLGPHFWWSGGLGPPGPPWIRPWTIVTSSKILTSHFLDLTMSFLHNKISTMAESGWRIDPPERTASIEFCGIAVLAIKQVDPKAISSMVLLPSYIWMYICLHVKNKNSEKTQMLHMPPIDFSLLIKIHLVEFKALSTISARANN